MAVSVVRKGRKPAADPNAGKFVKLKEGDSVIFAPMVGLDEMVSIDQHEFWDINPALIVPCLQDHCPACATGNEPKFKAFLPVLTKEGEAKIFSFGIKLYRNLEEIEDELGSLKGKQIKVTRRGSGFSTTYSAVPLGKSVKIDDSETPDVEAALNVKDREQMIKALEESGLIDEEDAGEMRSATVTKAKKASKPAETKAADGDDEWAEV